MSTRDSHFVVSIVRIPLPSQNRAMMQFDVCVMFYWWNKVCHTNLRESWYQLLTSGFWKLTTIKIKGPRMLGAHLPPLADHHSFRLDHSSQYLGQRGLTWWSNLHTKKSPFPPPPFFFLNVRTVLLAECQRASLCLSLLCHISSSESAPPASSHHAREGKQSWHVSLMRSRARSVGKELRFHTH